MGGVKSVKMGERKLKYISLFSGGGVGCYGFLKEGFECVVTCEIIKRRLEVQKFNKKCKYESGYIGDDITKDETKQKIFDEIKLWKEKENLKEIDVLIATPPCQGMSSANGKKNENDIVRNSLVVESIKLVKEILPRFFVFENVSVFLKTDCIVDNKRIKIGDYIENALGKEFSIYGKVVNFKNYGVPSSRKRCLAIGVRNDIAKFVSPLELFPDFVEKEITIRNAIFNLKRLTEMGEIDDNDIYHFFRCYEPKMRDWIKDLKEGQSAFDNNEPYKKPHVVDENGKIKINENKMGGKYKRQKWDDVASCVHTRNDQLASQNTIHPEDDRVFSIRELMKLMSVDNDFRWSEIDENVLNHLKEDEKRKFLKKNEINIRQVLGEAVPTLVFREIAKKIKSVECGDGFEKENPNREKYGAYFTDKFIANEIVKNLPDFKEKEKISILEPSVGVGSFVPLLFKKYEGKEIEIDVIDIDKKVLEEFENNFKDKEFYKKVKINNIDFFEFNSEKKYDLIVGNPPFIKINNEQKETFKKEFDSEFKNNFGLSIVSYFILKSLMISNYVCFVLPKHFLISPQYDEIRNLLKEYKIDFILDFENKGFSDVIIETIALGLYCTKNKNRENEILVINENNKNKNLQKQNYIIDDNFRNWIIYRDKTFDDLANKMLLDIFNVFRDRQITNKFLTNEIKKYKVLRSRNLTNNGEIIEIKNYDKYLKDEIKINDLTIGKFLDDENCYLCPNFTTNLRVVKKPKNVLVNGSLGILKLKNEKLKNKIDLEFYRTKEFIEFYKCSNNYQKNTINLDKNSIFYFGILKERLKDM